ncbi:catalase [Sciscionella sediminilitoris]|uniref:catalase n=1 Tax=Sciscionella sediminilitoris TaxID=1445613 RepID=UPI0004DEE8CC|nr:catalase [Sciscionella sp. SE31]
MTQTNGKYTTTDAGIPVESDEHSLTVGSAGPILLQDAYLIEQMAQFNRERIPERQPHAKGSGAFGRFEVTNDVSAYTKAEVFQPGTTTGLVARFSTVAGERGSPDTWRDPRGFALKFYTPEGNYDLVGNNTPVFFVKDPMKFQHFIRSQKRLACNNLRDHDMQWDFWTLSPESAHQVTWLMGDRGIPRTWRHMNGYGSHTYMWINESGERFWVKYTFKTDQGIEFFTQHEGDQMCSMDTDYHTRDLWEHIRDGDHPSWTMYVQIMPYADAAGYRFNPFDLTKVWPHGDYPLIEVGRMTLDRNPTDNHTEIEQAAFQPNNLVPGIGPSPDRMLLARLFSYADAQRARIGANYQQLPVNTPRMAHPNSYTKDGAMRFVPVCDPVYAPNSKGGPVADVASCGTPPSWYADGEITRTAHVSHPEDDDWGQARALIREVMDEPARERLVDNVVGHLLNGVTAPVLERAFGYWRAIDTEVGDRIRSGVQAKKAMADPKAEEQGNAARSGIRKKS